MRVVATCWRRKPSYGSHVATRKVAAVAGRQGSNREPLGEENRGPQPRGSCLSALPNPPSAPLPQEARGSPRACFMQAPQPLAADTR